jgi:hypothetical protein
MLKPNQPPGGERRGRGKTSSFGDVAKFCVGSKVLQTVENSGVGCLERGSDQRKPRSVVALDKKRTLGVACRGVGLFVDRVRRCHWQIFSARLPRAWSD